MERLDIRRAAGQQQTVEPVEHRAAIDLRAERRDHQRHAARGIDHGVWIALVDGMEIALAERAHAARDSNERQGSTRHGAGLLLRF